MRKLSGGTEGAFYGIIGWDEKQNSKGGAERQKKKKKKK